MKRLIVPFSVLFVSSLLPGCPIYGNGDQGCLTDSHCARGYSCDSVSGLCLSSNSCESPRDCSGNETCSRSGRCVTGDCTFARIGCVSGYVCEKPQGVWECVPQGLGGGGTSGESGAGGAAGEAAGAGGMPDAASGTGGATEVAGGASGAAG